MKKLLLLMAIPCFTSGKITPEITIPDSFSDLSFDQLTLHRGNYLSDAIDCKIISLKLYHPSQHHKYPPSASWFCLFAVDVISNGYGPGQALSEKVYLNKKAGLWRKKKSILNKKGTQRSLEVYGIKSLSE